MKINQDNDWIDLVYDSNVSCANETDPDYSPNFINQTEFKAYMVDQNVEFGNYLNIYEIT